MLYPTGQGPCDSPAVVLSTAFAALDGRWRQRRLFLAPLPPYTTHSPQGIQGGQRNWSHRIGRQQLLPLFELRLKQIETKSISEKGSSFWKRNGVGHKGKRIDASVHLTEQGKAGDEREKLGARKHNNCAQSEVSDGTHKPHYCTVLPVVGTLWHTENPLTYLTLGLCVVCIQFFMVIDYSIYYTTKYIHVFATFSYFYKYIKAGYN